MNDDIVARVTAAVQRGRAGEQADARRELNAMWVEPSGATTTSTAA